MENLTNLFGKMTDLIINTYKGSWPIVKDTAVEYLYYTEKRFASYANMIAAGVDDKHMALFMEAEKGALLQQLETMGIITASSAQGLANSVIKIFTDAYLPVIPEPVNTSEAAFSGRVAPTVYGEEFLGASRIVAPPVTANTPGTIAAGKGTQFGVFTSGELSITEVITLAGKLGVTLVRLGINADAWKGKSVALDQLLRAGLKVVVTLNWNSHRDSGAVRVAQPWVSPEEYQDYSNWVEDVITKYPAITAVVIGNEETVDLFNSGTAQEYKGQLAVASKVCRKHGIPVTNGGLTNPGLQILAYRNLVQKNKSIDADNFYNKCMDQRIGKAAKYPNSNKELEAKATETEYLLQNYGKLVDFVNIHWYEPLIKTTGIFNTKNKTKTASPGALKAIVEYITDMTGKPVISNETGTLNGQTELVPAIMQDMQAQGVKVCVWFSATSDNGQTDPLNSGTDLTNMGDAFQAFIN